jgi:hypothetical protein
MAVSPPHREANPKAGSEARRVRREQAVRLEKALGPMHNVGRHPVRACIWDFGLDASKRKAQNRGFIQSHDSDRGS